MFKRVQGAVIGTGTLVTTLFRRGEPARPRQLLLDKPTSAPEPPIPHGDTKTYVFRNTKERLDSKQNTWDTNLYTLAQEFYEYLLTENILRSVDFMDNDNRAIIREHMTESNAIAGRQVVVNEANLDAMEGLFSGMMTAIRCDDQVSEPKEPFLQWLEWDMVSLSPAQSAFHFTLPSDEVIEIDAQVKALKDLYHKWIQHYTQLKIIPAVFVHHANQALNKYFEELLKINLDEEARAIEHWGTQEVQQALSYYFDQRELLFRIYLTTAFIPSTAQSIESKIEKMRPYVRYIKNIFARQDEYSTKIDFGLFRLNCGIDRMTKINAALEKYHSICTLPEDRPPINDIALQPQIRAALNNGRLYKLSQ